MVQINIENVAYHISILARKYFGLNSYANEYWSFISSPMAIGTYKNRKKVLKNVTKSFHNGRKATPLNSVTESNTKYEI